MPQTMIKLTCSHCGTVFSRRVGTVNQKKKLGSKPYCSHRCSKLANPTPPRNLAIRFWSKVKKTEGCWLWNAGTVNGGYGVFWYQGKMARASHIAYFLQYGIFPNGFELLHKCDNPPCVRPDHLVKGTHAENMLDMKLKGRGGVGKHVRGETNGHAKLKEIDVMVIRERLKKGDKHSDIAKDYHVSRTTITSINSGGHWAHVSR